MYIPEYTITNRILRNIAQIEFSRALIDNTTILASWEKQLQKDAKIRTIHASLKYYGLNTDNEDVKRFLDGMNSRIYQEVKNLSNALNLISGESRPTELNEAVIKELHLALTEDLGLQQTYRKRKLDRGVNPEEILAEVVSLIDWYNSLDARETHPVIRAGIIKAEIERIIPFENTHYLISNLVARYCMNSHGMGVNNYYCLEEYYSKSFNRYQDTLTSIIRDEGELTEWLEYFTEGLSVEITNIMQKVLLLARDTKVAKASGRVKLSDRQERLIEYLQDYGLLQNKDFSRLYPDVSEDSILRDLKVLIGKGIVVKTGSTKSSRYELS